MPFPSVNRLFITSTEQRRFFLKQVAWVTVANFAVNGFLTWFFFGSGLLFEPLTTVSIWGLRGMALDVAITTFVLSLLTLITISRTAHKSMWDKHISSIKRRKVTAIVLDRFPTRLILIGLYLAIIATLILAPLVVGAIVISNLEAFDIYSFVLFKAVYAGSLAAVITALVILDSFYRRDVD